MPDFGSEKGFLYMQTSPGKTERVSEFRTQLLKTIGDKHEAGGRGNGSY